MMSLYGGIRFFTLVHDWNSIILEPMVDWEVDQLMKAAHETWKKHISAE